MIFKKKPHIIKDVNTDCDVGIMIRNYQQYASHDFSIVNKNKKLYFTEILCISNSKNIINLKELINWYTNILHVEHFILIDNNDTDRTQIFANTRKLTYIHKPGVISQSDIYTEHINKFSYSEWVLPIDDDEYLYIPEKFNHDLNEFLRYNLKTNFSYKYSFPWHMMYHTEIIDKIDNDYSFIDTFRYSNYDLDSYFDGIYLCKTIVNTAANHLYLNENGMVYHLSYKEMNFLNQYGDLPLIDIMGTVHNPISKLNNIFCHSYCYTSNKYSCGLYYNGDINLSNEVFIAHYKYRTLNEFKDKCKNFKFFDAPKSYTESNYTVNKYLDIYNIVTKNLQLNDKIYNLNHQYANS